MTRSEYWTREAVAESGWWKSDTGEIDLDALRSSIASAISAAIEEDRRLRSDIETPIADLSLADTWRVEKQAYMEQIVELEKKLAIHPVCLCCAQGPCQPACRCTTEAREAARMEQIAQLTTPAPFDPYGRLDPHLADYWGREA